MMIEKEITKAVDVLRKGGVIIYPTDTIWGIGCDATNEKAVKKIYDIKRRLEEKTMIVLLSDKSELKDYLKTVPPIALDLIDSWKKPLTIVYDGAENLAKNLIRDDNTVAMRISRDEFSQKVIQQLGKPLVSTSANRSGEKAPLFYKSITKEILNSVDHIVNLYHDSMNDVKPSTIIRLYENGNFEVLRD